VRISAKGDYAVRAAVQLAGDATLRHGLAGRRHREPRGDAGARRS